MVAVRASLATAADPHTDAKQHPTIQPTNAGDSLSLTVQLASSDKWRSTSESIAELLYYAVEATRTICIASTLVPRKFWVLALSSRPQTLANSRSFLPRGARSGVSRILRAACCAADQLSWWSQGNQRCKSPGCWRCKRHAVYAKPQIERL